MPSEATGPGDALRLADERMYAQKASRATDGAQAAAALVQVLVERDVELSTHIGRVTELAIATAQRLRLSEREITRLGPAAQLHDIGKTAIPESILNKPGSLNEDEGDFIRRHTLIGERIISAAPSLAHTATLVRSSHERLDGNGYPDGLAGSAIPVGSKIIAVCDAYDAMVSPRPYRTPKSTLKALEELRACAGSQFDPQGGRCVHHPGGGPRAASQRHGRREPAGLNPSAPNPLATSGAGQHWLSGGRPVFCVGGFWSVGRPLR